MTNNNLDFESSLSIKRLLITGFLSFTAIRAYLCLEKIGADILSLFCWLIQVHNYLKRHVIPFVTKEHFR